MIVRVKDLCGSIQPLKDHASLFGDRLGDDCLTDALIDRAAVDKDKGQFRFVASTDAVDLDDEIIAAGAFHELRGTYERNPVMLIDHQHRLASGLSPQAATCLKLYTEKDPVWGVGEMADTTVGRDRAPLILAGKSRGISVGFRSREVDRTTGRLIHTKALLLEISLVSVPANPQALVLTYVQGRLGQHGARSITDPVQADEWTSMLKELHEQFAQLQATLLTPNAGTTLRRTFGDGDGPNADGLADYTFEQSQIDECLDGASSAFEDDEFADYPEGECAEEDDFGTALALALRVVGAPHETDHLRRRSHDPERGLCGDVNARE